MKRFTAALGKAVRLVARIPLEVVLVLAGVVVAGMVGGGAFHGLLCGGDTRANQESWSIAEPWSGPAPEDPTLFPARQNGKWGYIDRTGRVAIDFQYDQAQVFSEGMAGVKVGEEYGYIDGTGTMVLALRRCYGVGPFNGGLAPIDEINPTVYTEVAVLTTYINPAGGEVISSHSSWSSAREFSEGLAAFYLLAEGCGYIDKTGREVIRLPDATNARSFHDGLAAVEEGLWGYIDRSGQFAFDPEFISVTDFRDGVAVVEDHLQNYWVIDRTGRRLALLPHQPYEQVLGMHDGLAPALVWHGDWPTGEGSWGYVDATGAMVIAPQFGYAFEFSGGLAMVFDDNDRMSYIDVNGKYVWREQ